MDKNSCTIHSVFYYPDFDRNDHIKPSAILRNFQQVSGIHAEMSGRTVHEIFVQTGKVYIVARYEAEILRQPVPGEMEVKTWIESLGRVYVTRCYEIRQKGEVVIRGAGLWFMYDLATRLPCRAHLSIVDLPACPVDPEHPYDIGNFKIENELPVQCEATILYAQCDTNHHANNTCYPDFCQQITRDAEICGFRIAYKHECYEGETITLTAAPAPDGSCMQIRGVHQNGTTAFEAEFKLKQGETQ